MSKRLSLLPNFFISLSSSSSGTPERETTKKKNLKSSSSCHNDRENDRPLLRASLLPMTQWTILPGGGVHVVLKKKRTSSTEEKENDENDDFSPHVRTRAEMFPNGVSKSRPNPRKRRNTIEVLGKKKPKNRARASRSDHANGHLTTKTRSKKGRIDGENTDHVRFWRHDCALFERALHAEASVYAEFRRGRVELWEREERFSRD